MNLIYRVNIILYLIVGTVPNLESLDKVATQWLYLNLLNTLSLLFYLIKDYPIKDVLKDKATILFVCFFTWSAISLIFAINKIESLVVLSQIFAIVIAFIVLMICIRETKSPLKFISNSISFFLIIELIYIYIPFFTLDVSPQEIFSRSNLFLGFAANVNITAFSIIYKIPFLIFSIMHLKKLKIVSYILALVVFVSIIFVSGTLNSTRGAILTYSSLALVIFVISTVIFFKSKNSKLLIISSIYSLIVLISFPLNSIVADTYQKSQSSVTNRMKSLNALIDEDKQMDQSLTQRSNFYKQALNTIKNYPIFGVGIGNWKIKSIDTNKENIVGYTVPYHVHNDYLEIGAEIGLIGLGIYLFILFISFKKHVLKFLKAIFTHSNLDRNYLEDVIIFLFLLIWIIDSNFNFPFHRPIELINLIVLLAYLNSKEKSRIYDK